MILLLLLAITTHGIEVSVGEVMRLFELGRGAEVGVGYTSDDYDRIEMSVGDLVKVYELGEKSIGKHASWDITHNGYQNKGWLVGDPRTFMGNRPDHSGLVCEDDPEFILDTYGTYNPEYAGLTANDFEGEVDSCAELALIQGGAEAMCNRVDFNKIICCAYCEEYVGGAEDHLCEILDWYGELTCADEAGGSCTGANINDGSCSGYRKGECDASCYIHGHNHSGCSKKSDYVKGSTCQRKVTAVPGCTDATAINYNAAATQDDGSCEHKVCTEDCKYWMGYYTCDKLTEFGMDCYACDCGLTCSAGCQDFLDQHFTCDQLAEKGMDCSACDCTASCHPTCEQYLDTFTCDQLAAKGLDCSPCNCSPKCFDVCTQYLSQGVTCDTLAASGYDCSACAAC